MRFKSPRFVSSTLILLALSLTGVSIAQAQTATFEGTYDVPWFFENMLPTTITVEPGVELSLTVPSGASLLGFFLPMGLTLDLAGTPFVGGTQYAYSGMAGDLTVTVMDSGQITVDGANIPGWVPGPAFTGMGTIQDPTFLGSPNAIAIDFTADPGQGVAPPNNTGSLAATVTAPLPMPMPTLPWPMLLALALLLVVFGVRATQRRTTASA